MVASSASSKTKAQQQQQNPPRPSIINEQFKAAAREFCKVENEISERKTKRQALTKEIGSMAKVRDELDKRVANYLKENDFNDPCFMQEYGVTIRWAVSKTREPLKEEHMIRGIMDQFGCSEDRAKECLEKMHTHRKISEEIYTKRIKSKSNNNESNSQAGV